MDYFPSTLDQDMQDYVAESSPQTNSLFPVAPRKKTTVHDNDSLSQMAKNTLGNFDEVSEYLQQDSNYLVGVTRQPQTPIATKSGTLPSFQRLNGAHVPSPLEKDTKHKNLNSAPPHVRRNHEKDTHKQVKKEKERPSKSGKTQTDEVPIKKVDSSKTKRTSLPVTPEKSRSSSSKHDKTPVKQPPNGLKNGLAVPQNTSSSGSKKLPKLVIPNKEKHSMPEPVMEELFRELAHPPLITAIQTPNKKDKGSKFPFAKENANQEKTADSRRQDEKTSEKLKDKTKKEKDMKYQRTLSHKDSSSDSDEDEKAGPKRNVSSSHSQKRFRRSRTKTVSSSSSSSSDSDSSSGSDGEVESHSDSSVNEKTIPAQETKDEDESWGLEIFKKSSGDSGPSSIQAPVLNVEEPEEPNTAEDLFNNLMLDMNMPPISPSLEKEMDTAVKSAQRRAEQTEVPSPCKSKHSKTQSTSSRSAPQAEVITPTKSTKAKSSTSNRRSNSKSPCRSQGSKSVSSSQNSVKSPVNEVKNNRTPPKVSDKHSPVKAKARHRPKTNNRVSPKSRAILSSTSSSSESESESDFIDVVSISPKTAKSPIVRNQLNKERNMLIAQGDTKDSNSGHRKREKRKHSESKHKPKSRSKPPSLQSTPVKAESNQVLKTKQEPNLTSPVKTEPNWNPSMKPETGWSSQKSHHLLSPLKSREHSPVVCAVRPLTFENLDKTPVLESVKPYHSPIPEINILNTNYEKLPVKEEKHGSSNEFKPGSSNEFKPSSSSEIKPSCSADEVDSTSKSSTGSLIVRINLSLLQRVPGRDTQIVSEREPGEVVESPTSMHSDVFEETKFDENMSLDSDIGNEGPEIMDPSSKEQTVMQGEPQTNTDKSAPKLKERETVEKKSREVLNQILGPSRPDIAPVGKIPKIPKRKTHGDGAGSSPKRSRPAHDYDTNYLKDRDRDRVRGGGSNDRNRGSRERDRGSRERERERLEQERGSKDRERDRERERDRMERDRDRDNEDGRDWHRKSHQRTGERRNSNSSTSSRISIASSRDGRRMPEHERLREWDHNPHKSDWDAPYSPSEQLQGSNIGAQWGQIAKGRNLDHQPPPQKYPKRKEKPVEKLLSVEEYLKEAKTWKHKADALKDKWGKIVAYTEAVLRYTLGGYAMEQSTTAKTSKIYSMYRDTLAMLVHTHTIKIRGPDMAEAIEKEKKLAVLRFRINALLSLKLYQLKKSEASKLKRALDEHNKSVSSSAPAQAPSPYQPAGSNRTTGTPSPMSPTPSPAGSVGSVGSVGSESRMVNGSTAPLAPPGSIVVPQRIHSISQQYLSITNHLVQSHENWDQADLLEKEFPDFFQELNDSYGPISLHSNMWDLVQYMRQCVSTLQDT